LINNILLCRKGIYELDRINKHLLVKGFINEAPGPEYLPVLNDWFLRLIKAVDMKVLMEPNCLWCEEEGNEGVTGVAGLTTSHTSIHFWPTHYMFDLYSCKDFTVSTVSEMLKEFGTTHMIFQVVDRDSGEIIDQGTINY
jgi:S-adenosylmethionine/arginine decarboxylase-like enzyme